VFLVASNQKSNANSYVYRRVRKWQSELYLSYALFSLDSAVTWRRRRMWRGRSYATLARCQLSSSYPKYVSSPHTWCSNVESSQDSFYKFHDEEELALAHANLLDFDHPDALDMPMFAGVSMLFLESIFYCSHRRH